MINCIESLGKSKTNEISLEAIKIGRDYPELTVEECLKKAKEIYSYDEN
jgi:hypothetical protein